MFSSLSRSLGGPGLGRGVSVIVRWLVRLRIGVARPIARGRKRLIVGPFVGVGLTDDQIVLEQLVVALGVRHRRLEQLAPVARHLTRGEGEDSACLLHGLAAAGARRPSAPCARRCARSGRGRARRAGAAALRERCARGAGGFGSAFGAALCASGAASAAGLGRGFCSRRAFFGRALFFGGSASARPSLRVRLGLRRLLGRRLFRRPVSPLWLSLRPRLFGGGFVGSRAPRPAPRR